MTHEELRAALLTLRWSRRKLARELDVGERTMRHWCSGSYPVPKTVEYAVRYLIDNVESV